MLRPSGAFILLTLCLCTTRAGICGGRAERWREADALFTRDPRWLGGDGASSIDLGNDRVLWLFGDSFVGTDSSGVRSKATFVRNSIAVQNGRDPTTAAMHYYWGETRDGPHAFFSPGENHWYWPGHGIRVGGILIIFLMKVRAVGREPGFEVCGSNAVRIDNPDDPPDAWKIAHLPEMQTPPGVVVGSAAVIRNDGMIHAFCVREPDTHEVYVVRWSSSDLCDGNWLSSEWWTREGWKQGQVVPETLFTGATEFSVNYLPRRHQFIQVQASGYGHANVTLRCATMLQGPWSEPLTIFAPVEFYTPGSLIYAAKAHPELGEEPLIVTFNINNTDSRELLNNQHIYYPRVLRLWLGFRQEQ